MRLYVSADIEGVAGIAHWDQIMPGSADYCLGRRLLMGELKALCEGAREAGVEEIAVNDAHGPMRNIVPDELPESVRLMSGHFKPMYMMEGLDDKFDAAVFLGYHGPAGASSVLSHTYSPRVVWQASLNGVVTGETGINALVAHHYGVPVVLITGDEWIAQDAHRWIPEARTLAVKRSVSRFSADSMSPVDACEAIRTAIGEALSLRPSPPAPPENPIELELTFQSGDMAILASWVGAERTDERVAVIKGSDGLEVYRRFHVVLLLARTVAEV